MKIKLDEARQLLMQSDQPFVNLYRHGTMDIELFAPKVRDTQQPHQQDEIYVISKGQSAFILEHEKYDVKAGDVLFVKAGQEHRFVDFSPDFETWVIFYGPNGGE